MKTLKYLAMACIATWCVSCGNEDEVSKEWPTDVTLQVGESYSLEGAASLVNSNDFVLRVESYLAKDEIHALHVGNSKVTVTDENGEHIINVTVNGRYNSYPDPITEWLITPEQVKEKYQVGVNPEEILPTEEDPYYAILYRNVGKAMAIEYVFSENQLVTVVAIVSKDVWSSEIASYLRERFKMSYDGRNSAYAMAGTNGWMAHINSSVDYHKTLNEWVDVHTNQPEEVFIGGDYTIAFTSQYIPEYNTVSITYSPNYYEE